MNRRFIFSLLAAVVALGASAFAADKPSPKPNASETAFITAIQADLNARFPTPEAARKAGFLRYTDEDDTGAISYANREWTSADPKHPSQLWYDVKGRLLGADFSVLQADSPDAPKLWGVDPSRWGKLRAHVHFGIAGTNGDVYHGTSPAKYSAGGGDAAHPDAAGLVKAGLAKSVDEVRFVFAFPAIWDLTVWVLPNSDGAFADKNPAVVPTQTAKPM